MPTAKTTLHPADDPREKSLRFGPRLDDPISAVRITPFLEDVEALATAGAAIVAVDATDRPRPVPPGVLIAAIRRRGAIAMADISTEAEARAPMSAAPPCPATPAPSYRPIPTSRSSSDARA